MDPADLMDPDFVLYEELDPGVRETVRRLRAAGFRTTDSGDGVSKLAAGWPEEEIILRPHVFISVDHWSDLMTTTRTLYQYLLTRVNITSQSHALTENPPPREGYIEATYDPCDETCLIAVYNVTDDMWRDQ